MYIDRLVLIFIAGAYFLSPTLMQWWAESGTIWWQPFIVWGLLIAVTFWITRSRDLDGL